MAQLPSLPSSGSVPLAFGLLPRIEPEYEPVWGYSGRRRQPILIDDNSSVWLLWERPIGPAVQPPSRAAS